MLTFVGKEAGKNWHKWKDNLHYVDYTVLALIAVGIVYLLIRWRRNRGQAATEAA
jgi:membrane protein DedA with SNARE-associated domain